MVRPRRPQPIKKNTFEDSEINNPIGTRATAKRTMPMSNSRRLSKRVLSHLQRGMMNAEARI